MPSPVSDDPMARDQVVGESLHTEDAETEDAVDRAGLHGSQCAPEGLGGPRPRYFRSVPAGTSELGMFWGAKFLSNAITMLTIYKQISVMILHSLQISNKICEMR